MFRQARIGRLSRSSLEDLIQPRSLFARTPPNSSILKLSSRRTASRPNPISRASYSTVIVQSPQRSSRLPRILLFSVISLSAFTYSFFFGLDYLFPFPGPFMGSLPSDEESLSLYEPTDDFAREVEDHIHNHPLVVKLRNDPKYVESRPHMKIPKEVRGHSLLAGTLAGPEKIVVPPYFFNDTTSHKAVCIFYLGQDVSGHPGMVHGGLLAAMLDEGLARCCFPALPNKVGVTAMLNIEYKKPSLTGSFFVLKATTTKVEGRKAFVEGHIETMVGEGEQPEILVSAKALFIEPRAAKAFTSLYKVT